MDADNILQELESIMAGAPSRHYETLNQAKTLILLGECNMAAQNLFGIGEVDYPIETTWHDRVEDLAFLLSSAK